MGKKYVIKDAVVNCQYGIHTATLQPYTDRHICVGDCQMANETDISRGNFAGGFGACRSPFLIGMDEEQRESWQSSQELAAYGLGMECQINIPLPWQNTREDVCLAEGCRALMEDGWTICATGLGIISVINSGQAEEDQILLMQEKLQELQAAVDAYMKENGIREKERDNLLESVLLWNGYLKEDKPWEYETSQTNRAFCAYLEQENPSLFNYFERGLYVEDSGGETIDVSYMLGINKALNSGSDQWETVTRTITEDRGMYNGFLEACGQERGRSTGELLDDFLNQVSQPDYNGSARYTEYMDAPSQDMRDMYCSQNFYDPESLTVQEQNRGILHNMITGRIQGKMYSEQEDLNNITADQAAQADAITNDFLDQLEQDIKGR